MKCLGMKNISIIPSNVLLCFASSGSWQQPTESHHSVWEGDCRENRLSGRGGVHQPDHRAGQPTGQGLGGEQGGPGELGRAIWAGLAKAKLSIYPGGAHGEARVAKARLQCGVEVVTSWEEKLTVVWTGFFQAGQAAWWATCETGREGRTAGDAWLNWATGSWMLSKWEEGERWKDCKTGSLISCSRQTPKIFI